MHSQRACYLETGLKMFSYIWEQHASSTCSHSPLDASTGLDVRMSYCLDTQRLKGSSTPSKRRGERKKPKPDTHSLWTWRLTKWKGIAQAEMHLRRICSVHIFIHLVHGSQRYKMCLSGSCSIIFSLIHISQTKCICHSHKLIDFKVRRDQYNHLVWPPT